MYKPKIEKDAYNLIPVKDGSWWVIQLSNEPSWSGDVLIIKTPWSTKVWCQTCWVPLLTLGPGPQGETSQARQPFACDKVTFFRCHVQFEDVRLLTAMACPKDEDFRLDVKHETKKRFRQFVTRNMQRIGIPFEYGYFANQQTTASDALHSHERCMERVALCGFWCHMSVAQSVTDDVCQTCCFSDGVKPALRKNLDGEQWNTVISWYKWGNYSNEISMNISQSYWKAITICTAINDLTDFQQKMDVKNPDLQWLPVCSKKRTWKELEQCCLPTQLAWGLGETTCQAVFTWQPYPPWLFFFRIVGPRPLDEWLKGGWSHHGGGQNTHWRDVGLSYRDLAKCRRFFRKTVDWLAVEDADVLIVDH